MKHRKRKVGAVAATAGDKPRTQPQATPAAGPPLRAVLYLRCGSTKQVDREQSVAAQQHRCTMRARELEAEVVSEFTDFGSGLAADRPGLKELLHSIRAMWAADGQATQAVTLVIAWDHSRIARDVRTYTRIVWDIEQAGAQLIVASAPLEECQKLIGGDLS